MDWSCNLKGHSLERSKIYDDGDVSELVERRNTSFVTVVLSNLWHRTSCEETVFDTTPSHFLYLIYQNVRSDIHWRVLVIRSSFEYKVWASSCDCNSFFFVMLFSHRFVTRYSTTFHNILIHPILDFPMLAIVDPMTLKWA